jgi:phage terminase large subunit-like protein
MSDAAVLEEHNAALSELLLVLDELGLPVFPGLTPENQYKGRHAWSWRPTRQDEEWTDPGWRAVIWIERFCPQISGDVGSPLQLLPFQLAFVLEIFGRVDEDGIRVHTAAFLEWAKKNGKTTLLAAVALYCLLGDPVDPMPRVYVAAAAEKQTEELFEAVRLMREHSPAIKARTYMREAPGRKRCIRLDRRGFIAFLTGAAATQDGINPSVAIVDEVHRHKNREIWEILKQGQSTREQPLIIGITTAGDDDDSEVYRDLHGQAEKIQDGTLILDHWYVDVRNLPLKNKAGEPVDWRLPRYARVANPAAGTRAEIQAGLAFKRLDLILAEVAEVEHQPSRERAVRRLTLGQRVTLSGGWLPLPRWDEAPDLRDLKGRVAFLGLDLSAKTDLTAAALLLPDEDGSGGDLLIRAWMPGEDLERRMQRDNAPFDRWADEGWLTIQDGARINGEALLEDLLEWVKPHDVVAVGADPHHAQELIRKLEDHGLDVIEVSQAVRNLSEATKTFEAMVMERALRHDRSPLMRWCLGNVTLRHGEGDTVAPDKRRSTARIDCVAAAVNAIDVGMVRDVEVAVSAYSSSRLAYA